MANSDTTKLGACQKCGEGNAYADMACRACGSRLPWADVLHSNAPSAPLGTMPLGSSAPPASNVPIPLYPVDTKGNTVRINYPTPAPIYVPPTVRPATPAISPLAYAIFVLLVGLLCFWQSTQSHTMPSATEPGADDMPPAVSAQTASAPARIHKVEYELTGHAGSVDVTYRIGNSLVSKHLYALPWRLSFDAVDGASLFVSATNLSDKGQMSLTIFSDSYTIKSADSFDGFETIMCDGKP